MERSDDGVDRRTQAGVLQKAQALKAQREKENTRSNASNSKPRNDQPEGLEHDPDDDIDDDDDEEKKAAEANADA